MSNPREEILNLIRSEDKHERISGIMHAGSRHDSQDDIAYIIEPVLELLENDSNFDVRWPAAKLLINCKSLGANKLFFEIFQDEFQNKEKWENNPSPHYVRFVNLIILALGISSNKDAISPLAEFIKNKSTPKGLKISAILAHLRLSKTHRNELSEDDWGLNIPKMYEEIYEDNRGKEDDESKDLSLAAHQALLLLYVGWENQEDYGKYDLFEQYWYNNYDLGVHCDLTLYLN